MNKAAVMSVNRLFQRDIVWGYYYNGLIVRQVRGTDVGRIYNGAPLMATGCEFLYEPDQRQYCCHYADNNLIVDDSSNDTRHEVTVTMKSGETFKVNTMPRWNARGLTRSSRRDMLEFALCCDISDEARADIMTAISTGAAQ